MVYHHTGPAKKQFQDLVYFVTALAYYFCLALPAAFTQPVDHLLAEPCITVVYSGGGGIPALPEGMLLPMVCFVATLHHLLPPKRPTDGPNCATHRLIGIRLPSPFLSLALAARSGIGI